MNSNRNLKAKGGGGGSSTSGGGYIDDDRETPTWRPDPTYKYKYSLTKNIVTYKNDNWNAADNRTILPLYAYYMRENI